MAITHQTKARRQYRSKQPLYLTWEYIRKKAAKRSIPLQAQWRLSYDAFEKDVGPLPEGEKVRLVLINPERGYVWYNVRWLPEWRAKQYGKLEWLVYQEQRDEALTWARRFGLTLSEFQRLRSKGWSMRKIACHGEKLRSEKAKQALALVQAGVAVPNPDAG